ncbi:ImmA/IrrE family metallo-endopeptidase [bacterium]|nr:ImmA/IrrE family metallo-endopeptidase [bacterium]
MASTSNARAIAAAREIYAEFCLDRIVDIRIEALAMELGVFVEEDRLEGSTAVLIRQGNRGIVSVRSGISENGRRRFAIAHELGHFRLHKDKIAFACTDDMFLPWYRSSYLEPEANAFAAELLMPETSYRQIGAGRKPSRALFQNICDHFQTSLTASCFRYIEMECFPCALFVALDGKLKWVVKSQDLSHYQTRPINQPLDGASCAGEFFETGRTDENAPQQVLTRAWFSAFPRDSEFVSELPFCIPRLNMTLSLVWPE